MKPKGNEESSHKKRDPPSPLSLLSHHHSSSHKEDLTSSTDHLTISAQPEPTNPFLSLPTPTFPETITGHTLPIEKIAEEITQKAAQNNTVVEWQMVGGDEGIPHDQAYEYMAFKLDQMGFPNFSNDHFQYIVASIGKDNTWVIQNENERKYFLVSIRAYHNSAFDFSFGVCTVV